MNRNRLGQLIILCTLLSSVPGMVLSQDNLPEEAIVLLFGDLNRPADVLLGEAEAKIAKGELCMLLQQYLAIQGMLSKLRSPLVDLADDLEVLEAEKDSDARKATRFEHSLKQTESRIRVLSDKLDSSWLLPVVSSLDDKQAADLLIQVPLVQVTLRSRNGALLKPTKLTLVSPTEGTFRFAEIRPGVYIANPPIGEYQLGWQLTDKSIVQHGTKIDVAKQALLTCEVTLGPPDIEVKAKWPELNISGQVPVPAKTELGPPPDELPQQEVKDSDINSTEDAKLRDALVAPNEPSVVRKTEEETVFRLFRHDFPNTHYASYVLEVRTKSEHSVRAHLVIRKQSKRLASIPLQTTSLKSGNSEHSTFLRVNCVAVDELSDTSNFYVFVTDKDSKKIIREKSVPLSSAEAVEMLPGEGAEKTESSQEPDLKRNGYAPPSLE